MAFRHPGPADLPEVVSLFPLPGALLLPRSNLPLHIFEPRYLAMVEDALKSPLRMIAMIAPFGTAVADPQPETSRLSVIGCAGRITRFHEMDDGRLMITLTGLSRFRLRDEVEGFTPWRRAHVDWADFARDLGPAETDPALDRSALLALVGRFLAPHNLSLDLQALAAATDEDIVNALSMICPFAPADKQALLEAPSLPTRRETLVTLMEYALHGGTSEERPQ